MAEYTNDHGHVEIEDLPEGIQLDGIGDVLPEGGDDVKVPLMENGNPYPAHVPPEDPEMLDKPDCPDTGTEDDDDSREHWDEEADWYGDEGEEGSSDWDDEEAAESDSPRDRFSEFAGVSAALFDSICSALSDKKVRELEFSTTSGDIGAYFSIKTRDR